MPRIIHFEIQAAQPDRLITFYSSLFGWKFRKWDGPTDYWLINTGPDDRPGIDGGLLQRCAEQTRTTPPSPQAQQAPPTQQASAWPPAANAFVCTIDVEQIDEAVARAGQLGGTVAMPKTPVPGVGQLAYVNDPDGNLFGMMQMEKDIAVMKK